MTTDIDLAISGRLEIGETLSAWVLGTPGSVQWQALVNGNWVNVGTANSLTFAVPATAVGTAYRVAATVDGQTRYSPQTGSVTLDSKKSSAPVLAGSDLSVLGVEGLENGSVFSWLTLTDADRASFGGGSLLVQNSNGLAWGGDGHDLLSIRSATGAGQFRFNDATREVLYNVSSSTTVVIGTVDGALNGDGTDLKVALNANATVAIVDALVNNLQYRNVDDSPVVSRLLTLRITDGSGASAQRVTTVSIQPEPDAPVITSGAGYVVAENTAVVATLAAVDPDVEAGQPQGITWSFAAGEGASDNARFQIDAASGELRFAAVPDFEAADHGPAYSVRVRASDANGGVSEQVITVAVTNVNEAPVAADAAGAVGENGTPILVDPALADPEGGAVTVSLDATGTHGTVTQQGQAFLYDPAGRFESLAHGVQAIDRFQYTATDTTGLSITREVQVVVTGQNDAPVFSGAFAGDVTEAGAAGGGAHLAEGQFIVTDPDAGDAPQWARTSAPQYGFVGVAGDGRWSYYLPDTVEGAVQALAEGETLTDSFTVTAVDGQGATTTRQFDITIHGANDAPAALNPALQLRYLAEPEGTGTPLVDQGTLSTTDPEGDELTWGPAIAYGQYGAFYLDATTGDYRYEADAGAVDALSAGQSVTDLIRFSTADSHGATTLQSMSFIIQGSNDAPFIPAGSYEATVVEPVPDGVLRLDSAAAGGIYAVAQDTAGHLLITGRSAYGWSQTVMRFHADGTPDAGFATQGVAEVTGITVEALATDAAGRVLMAGMAYGGSGSSDFAISRLQTDGSLDTSFGVGGRVILDFAGDYDAARQVIEQPDGKLLVAGSVQPNAQGFAQLGIARLDANGMPDLTFGNGGQIVYQLADSLSTADCRVEVDALGRMLIWGSSSDPVTGERLTQVSRFLADGSADASFGNGGTAILSLGNWYSNKAVALALESDGGFVLGWNQYEDGQHSVNLTRFASDGQVDAAFGTAGTVATGLLTNYYSSFALELDAEGRVLVAPQLTATLGGPQDFTVARFLPDGSADVSFGLGGIARMNLGADDRVEHLLLAADGHIVAAGNVMTGTWGSESAALVRFTADGELDTGFGGLEAVAAEGWAWAQDPEGEPLAWSGSGDGVYGTLTVEPWGQWLYQLDPGRAETQALGAGQTGTDVFTLTVTDPQGASSVQELVITVIGSEPFAG